MTRSHCSHMSTLAPTGTQAQIKLFSDFDPEYLPKDFPDPYGHSDQTYDKMWMMLEAAMPAVLKHIFTGNRFLMAAYAASRVGLGIALILIGSVAANLLDVIIRLMQGIETVADVSGQGVTGEDAAGQDGTGVKAYTSFEILTVRTLWGLPLVIVFALVDSWWSLRHGGMGWRWRFPGYGIALVRSFLYLNIASGFFFALAYMPVGNVTLLFFVYPLFLTVLSVPILGDRVGLWRGTAVMVGFIGIGLVAIAMSIDPFRSRTIG